MKQKRITAKAVEKAYKKTGMTPMCESFFSPTGKRGCAIAALYAAQYRVDMAVSYPSTYGERADSWAKDIYSEPYVEGFVDGWDNKKRTEQYLIRGYVFEVERYITGWDDGQSLRKIFKPRK